MKAILFAAAAAATLGLTTGAAHASAVTFAFEGIAPTGFYTYFADGTAVQSVGGFSVLAEADGTYAIDGLAVGGTYGPTGTVFLANDIGIEIVADDGSAFDAEAHGGELGVDLVRRGCGSDASPALMLAVDDWPPG